MPDDLPFKKEEGWDYILTDDDRKKFAPKLATDEYWCHDEWLPSARDPQFVSAIYYRRRKTSGWVSVKERLPEPCKSFYATNGTQIQTYPGGLGDPEIVPKFWTHWMPWDFPALPQPPRPAAEVAEDKFWEWYQREGKRMDHDSCALKAFHTAIEYAKSNKDKL